MGLVINYWVLSCDGLVLELLQAEILLVGCSTLSLIWVSWWDVHVLRIVRGTYIRICESLIVFGRPFWLLSVLVLRLVVLLLTQKCVIYLRVLSHSLSSLGSFRVFLGKTAIMFHSSVRVPVDAATWNFFDRRRWTFREVLLLHALAVYWLVNLLHCNLSNNLVVNTCSLTEVSILRELSGNSLVLSKRVV